MVQLFCVPQISNAILYGDHQYTHLVYDLNTDTKEAIVGGGIREAGEDYWENALCYDVQADFSSTYDPSWWRDLVVPSTITYNNETYTVVGIAERAFGKTGMVHSITLPSTIRTIGSEAFYVCVSLESVDIPYDAPLSKIEPETFFYCKKLKSIRLPKHIKSIGAYAFSDCYELTGINIPGACLSIGNEAFKWCQKMEKLTIEDGEAELACGFTYQVSYNYGGNELDKPTYRGLFGDCPIKELYVGRNMTYPTIGQALYPPFLSISNYGYNLAGNKFKQGISFRSVEFGETVTEINDSLFWGCHVANEVSLPAKLRSIGKCAFCNNNTGAFFSSKQYQLTIPSSVERIDSAAFFNCTSLMKMIFESQTPPIVGSRALTSSKFYVPSGCGGVYRQQWNATRIIDPADELLTINVRTAGSLYSRILAQDIQAKDVYRLKLKGTLNEDDYATLKEMRNLYDCDLSELTIEQIPYNIFKESDALTYIKLPKNLTSIPDSMFIWCPYLSGVLEIPSTCTSIGRNAFYGTGITSINYESPIIFGKQSFDRCYALENLNIHGEGTIIGNRAFSYAGIKHLTLGNGVVVADSAFYYNSQLEDITFEDGVKSLGKNAFYSSDGLKRIVIKGDIYDIHECPFPTRKDRTQYDVYLSDITSWLNTKFPTLESSPLFLAAEVFLNNSPLVDVEIPQGVDSIRNYAFYNCRDLRSVSLPEGLKNIGEGAFQKCPITDLQLPSTLLSIEKEAFAECDISSDIDLPLSLQFIGEESFLGCSQVSRIIAHWDDPFVLEKSAFSGINPNSDCYLYIPIGTATKYVKSGWNVIPNMKEAGILRIGTNDGGSITYADSTFSNKTETFYFSPYKSFYVYVNPEQGKIAKIMRLNDADVSTEVEDGKLFFEEPEENFNLDIIFTNEDIQPGDVNDDGTVNVTDVINIANYILKKTSNELVKYIGDMNGDGIINVTDVIITVNSILNNE